MLAFFAALLHLAHAGDLVALPGSEVRLPLEPGFVLADRWVGVGNPASQASVMVTRIDAPVAQLVAGFTDEALAKQGVTVTARRDTQLGSYGGVWIDGTQSGARVAMAVVGDASRAWLLKGVAFTEADGAAVARMLEGAAWGEAAPAALVFDIVAPAGMLLAAEMAGSRLYTPDGTMGAGAGKPLFVVAPSVRPATASEDTARALFQSVAGLKDVVAEGATPVVFVGRKGWDVRGRGVDAATGAPMVAWQRILFSADGNYLRLVGVAPRAEADRWIPAWEAAAATLRDVK